MIPRWAWWGLGLTGAALLVEEATRRNTPGAPLQTRPVPQPGEMTDAQRLRSIDVMVAQLNALGFGPVSTGTSLDAPPRGFDAAAQRALRALRLGDTTSDREFAARLDDAYRARFGYPAAPSPGA